MAGEGRRCSFGGSGDAPRHANAKQLIPRIITRDYSAGQAPDLRAAPTASQPWPRTVEATSPHLRLPRLCFSSDPAARSMAQRSDTPSNESAALSPIHSSSASASELSVQHVFPPRSSSARPPKVRRGSTASSVVSASSVGTAMDWRLSKDFGPGVGGAVNSSGGSSASSPEELGDPGQLLICARHVKLYPHLSNPRILEHQQQLVRVLERFLRSP